MKLGQVSYEPGAKIPKGYRCTTCGVHGVKLWREYQTCADQTELVCCVCAGKSQNEDVSNINPEGEILTKHGDRTDSIGWRVPAIPTEEGDTFWGYTTVPRAGVLWWKSLPTTKTQCPGL